MANSNGQITYNSNNNKGIIVTIAIGFLALIAVQLFSVIDDGQYYPDRDGAKLEQRMASMEQRQAKLEVLLEQIRSDIRQILINQEHGT